jgi:hypothetical protein
MSVKSNFTIRQQQNKKKQAALVFFLTLFIYR